MRRLNLICLLALSASFPAIADDQSPQYATVGSWSINVDTTLGYGCFAIAEYDGGSALRFGFNMTDSTIYVLIGDPQWQSIQYGKQYALAIQFGDESRWTGNATGFSFNPPTNEPYLWMVVNSNEDAFATFFQEFMQEQSVRIFYKGDVISHLSLDDSYQAGLKLLECQKQMYSLSNDPFREASTNSDPFSN